jgi:hypothetical protein
MASDIRLRVGGVTVTRVLGGTDQQVGDALRRYAQGLGIDTTVTAQEWGSALLEYWVDEARRRSRALRLKEIEAAQAVANQQLAESETPL